MVLSFVCDYLQADGVVRVPAVAVGAAAAVGAAHGEAW
jgi:hypothetical protein